MSRRTTAILTAVGLLVMLVVAAVRSPVPFVALRPGPTLDVLGTSGEKPIVRIDDQRTYPTRGSLLLVTVSESTAEHQVLLPEALDAWWRPAVALIPREVAFPQATTNRDERAASAAQMVSSQETAVAAALRELGHELDSFAEVVGVTPGGPAEGELEVGDQLVSVDGIDTPDVDAVFEAVKEVDPGEEIVVEVRRQGEPQQVRVTTAAHPDDPERALIGVFPGTGYRFPFEVSLGIGDYIGGPSAGLVFALAVYDALTPGSLLGGRDVAGSGTIDEDGRVGGIGGIQQKVSAAARDGATLFLLHPDDCANALSAAVDPEEIALVPIPKLEDAIEVVTTHAEDPDAELPRCTDE
jgi:Lon-like protease